MQSNNNSSQPQQPYMFGGHPPGSRCSNTNFQQNPRGRSESVRDCMNWTNSLPTELQGNSNYSWGGMTGGNNGGQVPSYTYTMPNQVQQMSLQPQQVTSTNRPAPAAPLCFMSIPGADGKGDLRPLAIPIQVGMAGSKMGPLPTMKPLIINASAPTSGNGVAEPFTFQISADQYFGGGR